MLVALNRIFEEISFIFYKGINVVLTPPTKNLIQCWRLEAFSTLEQDKNHKIALALGLIGPMPPMVWFNLLFYFLRVCRCHLSHV